MSDFYSVRLLVVQWVVIGQYAMGRSLIDWSIVNSSVRTREVESTISLYLKKITATFFSPGLSTSLNSIELNSIYYKHHI